MDAMFNPNLLIVARQSRGITQKDLAQKAGLDQGYISKIENILTVPPREVVQQFSKILEYPESFFYQEEKTHGLPVSVHSKNPMYRKKTSVGKKDLDRVYAGVNIQIMHLKKLLKSVDFHPQLSLPEFDIEEYGGRGEAIAELIRGMWHIPPGPLDNLTEYVENAGVFVLWCNFAGTAVDGISLMIPGMPPCIFLNSSQPADRMRFTLGHELAHIILHKIPNPDMERQANNFASALLMPASDIKVYLRGNGRASLDRFASLKPVWRVAIQALVMRAKSLDVISPTQHEYLWKQISRRGMRTQEPPELDFPHEQPKLISHMINVHFTELGYTLEDLALALCMFGKELSQMYGLGEDSSKKRHLRVI